ncbi:MAG TPA: amidohydrolase, partial [Actinomycetes bacterium]
MSNRADLVITGARVYRGAGDASRSPVTGSWASAVALSGDRIVAVGTEAEVRDQVGSATEAVHLPGRLVVPGFQDAHIHPPQAGRNRLTVDLEDLPGREA